MYLQVPVFSSDPCSNGKLIQSAALKCSLSQAQQLVDAPNIGVKCGYVIYRVSLYRVRRCTKTIQLLFVPFPLSTQH